MSKKTRRQILGDEDKMNWRTSKPPEDRVFIADIGYSYPVFVHYNNLLDRFDYVFFNKDGNTIDFMREYVYESGIKRWCDIPKMPNGFDEEQYISDQYEIPHFLKP